MCVLARQTNAVWLLFIAGTSMLQALISTGYYIDNTLTIEKLCRFIYVLWQNKVTLLRRTWPLLVPVIVFAGYVVKTGSIVLGKFAFILLLYYVCYICMYHDCMYN